jgi:hypothetical protein
MSKPNFATMTRPEFRQYILEHREDEEAVSIYLERFQPANPRVYPPSTGFNDPEVGISYSTFNLHKLSSQTFTWLKAL